MTKHQNKPANVTLKDLKNKTNEFLSSFFSAPREAQEQMLKHLLLASLEPPKREGK